MLGLLRPQTRSRLGRPKDAPASQLVMGHVVSSCSNGIARLHAAQLVLRYEPLGRLEEGRPVLRIVSQSEESNQRHSCCNVLGLPSTKVKTLINIPARYADAFQDKAVRSPPFRLIRSAEMVVPGVRLEGGRDTPGQGQGRLSHVWLTHPPPCGMSASTGPGARGPWPVARSSWHL